MPKFANFNVVDYYDCGNSGMSVGCTPTSGVLRFQWSLEILDISKSMDIHGNWGRPGSGYYDWLAYDSAAHRFQLQQYSPWIYCYSDVTDVSADTVYDIEGIISASGMSITVNGITNTASGHAAASRDFWLFNNGSGNTQANVRTYSLKIWDNNLLIGDLLPVERRSDGKAGLWNQVNDEVYYPDGHESFYTDIPWIQGEDLFPYNENFIPMPEKALSEPPDAIFRIDETDDLPHTNLAPVLNIPALTKPFPDAVFRIKPDEMGGIPFNKLPPDCPALGAFANANNLIYARIPATVQKLGDQSFTNTLLKQVKISQDCTFDEETFPKGCLIEYYK